jgi:hypothetical protein
MKHLVQVVNSSYHCFQLSHYESKKTTSDLCISTYYLAWRLVVVLYTWEPRYPKEKKLSAYLGRSQRNKHPRLACPEFVDFREYSDLIANLCCNDINTEL